MYVIAVNSRTITMVQGVRFLVRETGSFQCIRPSTKDKKERTDFLGTLDMKSL
jgi:hypothetical protein